MCVRALVYVSACTSLCVHAWVGLCVHVCGLAVWPGGTHGLPWLLGAPPSCCGLRCLFPGQSSGPPPVPHHAGPTPALVWTSLQDRGDGVGRGSMAEAGAAASPQGGCVAGAAGALGQCEHGHGVRTPQAPRQCWLPPWRRAAARKGLTICLNSRAAIITQPGDRQIALPFGKIQENQQLTLINLLLTPDNEDHSAAGLALTATSGLGGGESEPGAGWGSASPSSAPWPGHPATPGHGTPGQQGPARGTCCVS